MTPSIFRRLHDCLQPAGIATPQAVKTAYQQDPDKVVSLVRGALSTRELLRILGADFVHGMEHQYLQLLGVQSTQQLLNKTFNELGDLLEQHKKNGAGLELLSFLGCSIPSVGVKGRRRTWELTEEQRNTPLHVVPGMAKLLWCKGLTFGQAESNQIRRGTFRKLKAAFAKQEPKPASISNFVTAADIFVKNLTEERREVFLFAMTKSNKDPEIGDALKLSYHRVRQLKSEVVKNLQLLLPFIAPFNYKHMLSSEDLASPGYDPGYPLAFYQTVYTRLINYKAGHLNRKLRFQMVRVMRQVRGTLTKPVPTEEFVTLCCQALKLENKRRPLIWSLLEKLSKKDLPTDGLMYRTKFNTITQALQDAQQPLTIEELSHKIGMPKHKVYLKLHRLCRRQAVYRGADKTYALNSGISQETKQKIIEFSREFLKTKASFYPGELITAFPELTGVSTSQVVAALQSSRGFHFGAKNNVSFKAAPVKEVAAIVVEELAKSHPYPLSEQQLLAAIKQQRAFSSVQICPTTLEKAGAVKYGYRMSGLTPAEQVDRRVFLSNSEFLYNFVRANGQVVPIKRLERCLGLTLAPDDIELVRQSAGEHVRLVNTPQLLLVSAKRSATGDAQFMRLRLGSAEQRRQMWNAATLQKPLPTVAQKKAATKVKVCFKQQPVMWPGGQLREQLAKVKPGATMELKMLQGDITRMGAVRQLTGINYVLLEHKPGQFQARIGAHKEQSVFLPKPLLLK